MTSLQGHIARIFAFLTIATLAAVLSVSAGRAAPFAAIVADGRSGEILYETNSDARLHPASLTKMMTLYIAFSAIERGEITLDTMVTVSRHAASQPPSKLGLRAGQKIALRYLIRAAALKSANDAATAIGEALSGSEPRFAQRMTETGKAIGMRNTTFRNANGLTAPGHLSTARDMNHLGRRLFFDFPQYYNIFSRRQGDAGMAKVNNTNRRFLDAYAGADGIKTGYTSPAGFNLTASAERGNKRIMATIFGGTSTAQRNAKMAELMDLGFREAPNNARVRAPAPAEMPQVSRDAVAESIASAVVVDSRAVGKTIRIVTSLKVSPRPQRRPDAGDSTQIATAEAVDAMQAGIAGALAIATGQPEDPVAIENARVAALAEGARPAPRPKAAAAAITRQVTEVVAQAPTPPEVIVRLSTSGGRHWGINLGRFPSRAVAERALMKTALSESGALGDGLRKVVERKGGYDANFIGLTQDQADVACRRIQARAQQCFTVGP